MDDPLPEGLLMAEAPQLVGGTWALASLEDDVGGVVRCHVSVAVAAPGELSASDLDTQVLVGGVPLEQIEGPADGPLPSVTITGTTAFAQYSFANPRERPPEQIVVTLGGETAMFDVSLPIV
jgi:hypothetical protein